ncbi:NAD(FAD)-utilizing dehydrogenase [Rhodovulum sp. P5]|uniref:NAD(P)/FAD-dependent oxidoreductase n=1 Tax=Rhodovulum sp. P5 TaxID=1564506 RepID=UPI0009C258BD|nr:NAD(P)/FAD-dependent oxidoreductase [Rhodovulum sp. P5]ARE38911.1 NAD(FAD)-utilizing dehydrogenase [Rhodovulum sp. P5]
MNRYDCLILGAGAAGMMCAAHAAAKGARVLVIDHARAPGEKIRISGGGRCNFTNLYAGPENYLSENPHFVKSALARYTQWDFIDLVGRHGIAWHEKTLGQLFCDGKATQIVDMLLAEMQRTGASLRLQGSVTQITRTGRGFAVTLETGKALAAETLVLATGGKSIPKMGATDFAHRIARQFGHRITETRPGLVPFTLSGPLRDGLAPLSGLSVPVQARAGGASFEEAMLITHRGLSGPAMLQVSSYWREGEEIALNLLPGLDAAGRLRDLRTGQGRKSVAKALATLLPARLADHAAGRLGLSCNMADLSDTRLAALVEGLTDWRLKPAGTEGYRTAEVTLGGIATDDIDARTMESRNVPGLYMIGEAVDVTGWLGGYNFQWAWSSGWAAGTAIAARLADRGTAGS